MASNEIAMSSLQLKYVPLRTLDWVAQSTIKVNLLLKVLLKLIVIVIVISVAQTSINFNRLLTFEDI